MTIRSAGESSSPPTRGLARTAYYITRTLTAATGAQPPLHIGDGIRRHDEDGTRTVWIVDVSLQGAKYIDFDPDGRFTREPFTHKENGAIGPFELGRACKQAIAVPCPRGQCSGINWYCRNNPRAYD